MLLFLVLVGLKVSTGSSVPESPENRLAQASNDFSFDLLKYYKNEKNVLLSPFSVSTALAMVYLGAEGTTAKAMREVLKYDQYGLTEQEVRKTFQILFKRLEENTNGYQFSTFNEVLIQKDFKILGSYRDALKQYYSAQLESVDFAREGEQVKAKINDDVRSATRGKINNFLDNPPSSDAKLFLLNAVYFLGNWESPFSPNFTYERSFYNSGVQEKKVPMMHRDAQYLYTTSDDLGASVVVLPYKGKSASMVIVLPHERTGVSEVERKLSPAYLEKLFVSTGERRLQLIFPKFNLKYSTNLVNPLSHLNLGELFSDRANLSGIAGNQTGLKVSSIAHKAVIDVNEKGSEAAAATGVEIIPLSIPPIFSVNHPFLFFIREEQTGMILFSGRLDEL